MTKNHHPADILAFTDQALRGKVPCALVVVTHVSGGAMRAPGALMAVTIDGDVTGYVSNGCVDGDIIAQAGLALRDKQVRRLRYGEGSPFRDIVLPCGGAIDLMIVPKPDPIVIAQTLAELTARRPVSVYVSEDGIVLEDPGDGADIFAANYSPKLRIRIAGRGAAVAALAGQAVQTGFAVQVQSPDLEGELAVSELGTDYIHLVDPQELPACGDDKWTAVVLLFHDHAWEPHLLKQALNGEAFYVGAMGSRKTHAARRDTLAAMGVALTDIDRIHGPAGLIPSMRDAGLMGLSILSEIVLEAQKQHRL